MPEGNADPLAVLAIINANLTTLLTIPTVIFNGQVTIAAPRVPLSAVAVPIKSVTIEDLSTNAVVWVGNATVLAGNGYELRPGAAVSFDVDYLSKVYVTGTVGNVVSYIAVA